MASEFRIQIQEDRLVLQVLAQLRGRMEDQAPAWQEAGDELAARADRRFETKTDPTGTPWEPWKASTRRARAKEGRGTLLEYTRMMRSSLSADADQEGLVLGMGRSYAPFHEMGTSRMVRRGVLLGQAGSDPRLAPRDERLVLDILTDFLSGGARV